MSAVSSLPPTNSGPLWVSWGEGGGWKETVNGTERGHVRLPKKPVRVQKGTRKVVLKGIKGTEGT